ncbi:putative metal-dependent hydrolase [Ameyamaea chiangmaiensis NBRC 103196]|uniref:Amidohydrolase n=1 Tax=Ameyamaea chiangmaiensis TaxID=442969 RepID=A0A850PHH1_9PROT|nr:amidohydrolase [Ameyamaea chiangmaiensis]MBS4076398.1 amidohydrolase [Ameyamaea chiangmaiensis]NVN41860.1 amidohydrolase [Ameyamaea chiangmaiensis]GBQ63444.1 putative metal-dependent hydrolase [Ameyamaea chiangmaiensis NBRC 103196]
MTDIALLDAILVLPDGQRLRGGLRIQGNRIGAIGTTAEILAGCDASTRRIDLDGACLLPGFIDSHLHLLMAAEYLSNIGLRDARSLAEVADRVARFAADHPERPWLVGHEWSYGYPDMPDGGFDRAVLDAVVPDRPVVLRSGMAHAAWVNSVALAIAGIDATTPDPDGGEIVRRPDGSPSGWLKEQAVKLVEPFVPAPDDAQVDLGLDLALAEIARCGITRVQSAAYDEGLLPHLAARQARGALTCRVGLMAEMPPPVFSEARLAEIEALRAAYDSPFLRLDGIKFFLDGVLESHTASMPQGYADRPGETGTLIWEPEAYRAAVSRAMGAGFQIWTHAIGSGAIALALDACAAEAEASLRLRPRVEHVEIPYAADIARFAAIGAVACLQPVMVAPSDEWMGMGGVWAQRVRAEEHDRAFPVRSLLESGAAVAFGTDWPIVSLSPLRGIRKAVVRRSLEGGESFVPEQAVTVAQAMHAYTAGGAYACLREATEGAIALGRLADLTILSADPQTVAPDTVQDIAVLMTIVDGRVVHDGRANTGAA